MVCRLYGHCAGASRSSSESRAQSWDLSHKHISHSEQASHSSMSAAQWSFPVCGVVLRTCMLTKFARFFTRHVILSQPAAVRGTSYSNMQPQPATLLGGISATLHKTPQPACPLSIKYVSTYPTSNGTFTSLHVSAVMPNPTTHDIRTTSVAFPKS